MPRNNSSVRSAADREKQLHAILRKKRYRVHFIGIGGISMYSLALLAKDGVQKPTPGMVLVYSEGQSYWYTGISASKLDASGNTATSGFMLVNARTKEAKYYKVAGVNEIEAKRIADDQNFAKAAGY